MMWWYPNPFAPFSCTLEKWEWPQLFELIEDQ